MEFLFQVKGVIFPFTSYLLQITYDYKMILCYVTPAVFQTNESGDINDYEWLLRLILHVNLTYQVEENSRIQWW